MVIKLPENEIGKGLLQNVKDLEGILIRPSKPVRGEPFLVPEGYTREELYKSCSHETEKILVYFDFLRNESNKRNVDLKKVISERREELIRNIVVAYENIFRCGPVEGRKGVYDKYSGDQAVIIINDVEQHKWKKAEFDIELIKGFLAWR